MNNENQNNLSETNPNEISIKVRSIDNEFLLDVNKQENVHSLKQKIESVRNIFVIHRHQMFQSIDKD